MADKSAIEWTDATWNPVAGCSVISPGCTNCYAMKMAARIERMQGALGHDTPYKGLTQPTKAGPVWTGDMRVVWSSIDQPIKWQRPRRIFVNSMSDLFHEPLDWEDIAQIYGTAIAAVHLRGHTFQILTKRAARMRELLQREEFWKLANATAEMNVLERVDPLARRKDDARATLDTYDPETPPPGIWLGVTTEDQERADERIPQLIDTPAAKRFISAEPLLGPLDILPYLFIYTHSDDAILADESQVDVALPYNDPLTTPAEDISSPRLDWVIAGGESGSRARPTHPDWIRGLRDQCQAAEVLFFFKQWGEYLPVGQSLPGYGKVHGATAVKPGRMKLHYGGTPQQAPKQAFADRGVRFTSSADGSLAFRVGKKDAGAILDGREWREFPT